MDAPTLFYAISLYEDVERLVASQIPEDLHLEYKSGQIAKSERQTFWRDIAQDISAFANSDGGTLIIGVAERDNSPIAIDGVNEGVLSREGLSQSIVSNIRPSIPDLRISSLTGEENKTVLIVTVPRSSTAPHQGPDNRYYRRYEFHNQALMHYEIEDLRRRQIATPPLVVVTTATRGGILSAIDIHNPGEYPAENITFQFSSDRLWDSKDMPGFVTRGIAFLGPRQRLRFAAQTFPILFADTEPQPTFTVHVEYTHLFTQARMSHVWPLDFESYRGSMATPTDEHQRQRELKEEMVGIRKSLQDLTSCTKEWLPKVIGANGIDLSVYTLRNLARIASGKPMEQLSPKWFTSTAFRDALNIDIAVASRLESLFRNNKPVARKDLVDTGLSDSNLERFEQTFQLGK